MNTVHDLFQQSKTEWINKARDTARDILATKYTVTIEDVLEICPRPSYIHRNTTGSVFNDDDFVPVGFVPSRRRVSHGRVVRVWTLKNRSKEQSSVLWDEVRG